MNIYIVLGRYHLKKGFLSGIVKIAHDSIPERGET